MTFSSQFMEFRPPGKTARKLEYQLVADHGEFRVRLRQVGPHHATPLTPWREESVSISGDQIEMTEFVVRATIKLMIAEMISCLIR